MLIPAEIPLSHYPDAAKSEYAIEPGQMNTDAVLRRVDLAVPHDVRLFAGYVFPWGSVDRIALDRLTDLPNEHRNLPGQDPIVLAVQRSYVLQPDSEAAQILVKWAAETPEGLRNAELAQVEADIVRLKERAKKLRGRGASGE